MMFASTRVVFFIGLLVGYGAVLIHAMPMSFTNSTSVSVSPHEVRQPKVGFLELNGEEHRIKFIMPMDDDPEVAGLFEMIDLFKKQRALVKRTIRPTQYGASQQLEKEVLYARTARIYLHHQADDTYDYLVIRDVRKGFPRQGSPDLKFFHEWYLEDFSINAKQRLADLRDLIERELSKWAADGLINRNIYLSTILVDRTFSTLMPIDWSPADDIYNGVEELPQDNRKTLLLETFYDDMEQFLPERFNINALKFELDFFGKDLREADGGPIDEIRLNGKNYDLEPLPKVHQGASSATYDFLDDFLSGNGSRVPAILKVVIEDGGETQTEKEIGYLRKVGLLLASKTNSAAFYIAMRNVRKDDPPLKPYHEWYLEDSSRNLDADLKTLQTNIRTRLMKLARDELLLYGDSHFRNIYVDETLNIVMPIDWGPPSDEFVGVEEATNRGDIVKYEQLLFKEIPDYFNREQLAYTLWQLYREKLRPGDCVDTAGSKIC